MIEDRFRSYYQRLYSKPPSADSQQIEKFGETLDLPSGGETQNRLLTSKVEIQKAINGLKMVKCPDFLYRTLQKFGFNGKAVQCVRTLYQSPQARIKVNGSLTDIITLERSTRQGCCLSPILFTIHIEPLAQLIRQNKDLKGIYINSESHIVGLFADDVLCYLTDPENSLPCLINHLKMFGLYSGYKLNLMKT